MTIKAKPGTFGALVRERRKALGLSQIDVETATGLSQGWISKVETGCETGLKEALMVCAAVKINVLELPFIDKYVPMIKRAHDRTEKILKKRKGLKPRRPQGQRRKA